MLSSRNWKLPHSDTDARTVMHIWTSRLLCGWSHKFHVWACDVLLSNQWNNTQLKLSGFLTVRNRNQRVKVARYPARRGQSDIRYITNCVVCSVRKGYSIHITPVGTVHKSTWLNVHTAMTQLVCPQQLCLPFSTLQHVALNFYTVQLVATVCCSVNNRI